VPARLPLLASGPCPRPAVARENRASRRAAAAGARLHGGRRPARRRSEYPL